MTKNATLTLLVALGALAATAGATRTASLAGQLRPGAAQTRYYTVGKGDYVLELWNLNGGGDLDAKVFAQDGKPLGKDTLDDNFPIVPFHSDRPQTVTVMAINASATERASFTGSIETDD